MKENIKVILTILTIFSCFILFCISLNCVIDTFVIYLDLIQGKNVEYQRFIIDILGCILMYYEGYNIANSE